MNDELEEHKLYGGERSNEPHFSTTSPFKMQLVKLCLKGPRGEVGRGIECGSILCDFVPNVR